MDRIKAGRDNRLLQPGQAFLDRLGQEIRYWDGKNRSAKENALGTGQHTGSRKKRLQAPLWRYAEQDVSGGASALFFTGDSHFFIMCGVDSANANIDTVAIGLHDAELDVGLKKDGTDSLLFSKEQHITLCVNGH